MKKLILQPEEILVPGEYELGNPSILQIYYRVFEKRKGACLPRAVVLASNVSSRQERDSFYKSSVLGYIRWMTHVPNYSGHFRLALGKYDNENLDSLIEKVDSAISSMPYAQQSARRDFRIAKGYLEIAKKFEEKIKGKYFLIDGNHRTTAATLAHFPIASLELNKTLDFIDITKMIKTGELFDFKRKETSLDTLYFSFVEYIIGGGPCRGGDSHMEHLKTVRERVDELVADKQIPQYMIDRYLSTSSSSAPSQHLQQD